MLVWQQVLCWRLKERMMRVSECHESVQESANELELSPADLGPVLDDSDSLETLRADSATEPTEPRPAASPQPQSQPPVQPQPNAAAPNIPAMRQRVR